MGNNWNEVQRARRKEEMAKLRVEYMQQQERECQEFKRGVGMILLLLVPVAVILVLMLSSK